MWMNLPHYGKLQAKSEIIRKSNQYRNSRLKRFISEVNHKNEQIPAKTFGSFELGRSGGSCAG